MEFALGLKPKEILRFHRDIQMDKRDAAFVRFLSSVMISIVLVVSISYASDHLGV
jgi:hypothetical protein